MGHTPHSVRVYARLITNRQSSCPEGRLGFSTGPRGSSPRSDGPRVSSDYLEGPHNHQNLEIRYVYPNHQRSGVPARDQAIWSTDVFGRIGLQRSACRPYVCTYMWVGRLLCVGMQAKPRRRSPKLIMEQARRWGSMCHDGSSSSRFTVRGHRYDA